MHHSQPLRGVFAGNAPNPGACVNDRLLRAAGVRPSASSSLPLTGELRAGHAPANCSPCSRQVLLDTWRAACSLLVLL